MATFLTVPAEVRVRIDEYALGGHDCDSISLCPCNQDRPQPQSGCACRNDKMRLKSTVQESLNLIASPLPLLCRQIRDESYGILLKHGRTTRVTITACSVSCLCHLLKHCNAQHRSHIRQLCRLRHERPESTTAPSRPKINDFNRAGESHRAIESSLRLKVAQSDSPKAMMQECQQYFDVVRKRMEFTSEEEDEKDD